MSILSQYTYINQTVTDESNHTIHFPDCAQCLTWQQLFMAIQNNETAINVNKVLVSEMVTMMERLNEIQQQYEGSLIADIGGSVIVGLFSNSLIGNIADSLSYGAMGAEQSLANEYNYIQSSDEFKIMKLMLDHYQIQCELDNNSLIVSL